MITADLPDPDAELKLFQLLDGNVLGDTDEEQVKHFAADFQGLQHFGQKIGAALDLGAPWLGAFREADFTHLWAFEGAGTSASDPGSGAIIESRVSLVELLETVTDE